MKTQKICSLLALVFATASVAGCHSAEPASTPAAAPPAAAQQAGLDAQTYQISHSNLPPDQKQRLLQQINASGKK